MFSCNSLSVPWLPTPLVRHVASAAGHDCFGVTVPAVTRSSPSPSSDRHVASAAGHDCFEVTVTSVTCLLRPLRLHCLVSPACAHVRCTAALAAALHRRAASGNRPGMSLGL